MTVAPAGSLLGRLWHLDVVRDGRVYHVDNVEGMCRAVLNRLTATLREPLEPCDYDESLMFLLGEAHIQAGKWQPARGATLGPFLHQRLGWRLLDYWEKTYGPGGEKRVCDLRASGQGRRDQGFEDDGDPGVRGLAGAAAQGEGDSAEAGADALGWLYARGDRETLREERRLGLDTCAGAPDGDRGAGAAAAGRVRPADPRAAVRAAA